MACIERRPKCGTFDPPVVPEPVTTLGAAFGIISTIITVLIGVGKAVGLVSVSGGVLSIGGVAIAGAAGAGALSALIAGAATLIVIAVYAVDRCTQGEGLRECIAGVVHEIVGSFSSGWDELFPFSATHDRLDVVAKSRFWDVIEDGDAEVHCTDEEPPRRSEIMRCYFYDRRVCGAADGAVIGGGVGLVAGVIAGALVAAAIGCATIILCLIALIVAALVAIVAVLVGALIGGQIGKAASTDDSPSADTGETLGVGNLVTVHGNMRRREHDDGANVLWWASSAQLHGNSASPVPFSYCEINDELAMDGCPVVIE